MTTIQQNLNLFSLLEQALKKASEEKQPVAVADLWANPDIQSAAGSVEQVRSKVKNLCDSGKAVQVPIAQSQAGDRKVRQGFMWKTDETAMMRRDADKKPNPVVFPTKDIELAINGTLIVIGKNPETGRIRITIDG